MLKKKKGEYWCSLQNAILVEEIGDKKGEKRKDDMDENRIE